MNYHLIKSVNSTQQVSPKKVSPKKVLATTVISLLFSSAVYANNACNVNLNAGVTIDESKIVFFESKKKQNVFYTINGKNSLIINNQLVKLNTGQQNIVNQYATSIRTIVPQARQVAIEGVDLAIDGVNIAFNELLGEGNSAGANLTSELTSIKNELAQQFTIKQGFTLGENGLTDKELLGADFEQRIESAIQKAVVNSMGTLLMSLGQQMFTGGDTKAFETKMENFSEKVEHEMELRAEKIEGKANSLCKALVGIDQLEAKLQSQITPLANIDVISAVYTNKHSNTGSNDKHEKKLM